MLVVQIAAPRSVCSDVYNTICLQENYSFLAVPQPPVGLMVVLRFERFLQRTRLNLVSSSTIAYFSLLS